jgi:hypothetical protein
MQIKYSQSYNYIYEQYTGVSGLNINVRKTTALCINTSRDLQEGLAQAGLSLTTSAKHLEILLAPTIEATIAATMTAIDPKAIEQRILATTPPTDTLHRALLVNLAFSQFITMFLWLSQLTIITQMNCCRQKCCASGVLND